MKIEPIELQGFVIKDAPSLDPITVITRDFAPGKGQLLVECYGEAWSAWWGSMGPENDVRRFVLQADADYVATKLVSSQRKFAYVKRIVQAIQGALRQLAEPVTSTAEATA
jgi:hypothetical protein